MALVESKCVDCPSKKVAVVERWLLVKGPYKLNINHSRCVSLDVVKFNRETKKAL